VDKPRDRNSIVALEMLPPDAVNHDTAREHFDVRPGRVADPVQFARALSSSAHGSALGESASGKRGSHGV